MAHAGRIEGRVNGAFYELWQRDELRQSIPLAEACEVALVLPITDDLDMRQALTEVIAACV